MCDPSHLMFRLHQGDIWPKTQSSLLEKVQCKYKFSQLSIWFELFHSFWCRCFSSDVRTTLVFRPGHVQGGSRLMKDPNTREHHQCTCAAKTTENHHQSRTLAALKEVSANSCPFSIFLKVVLTFVFYLLVYIATISQTKDGPCDLKR